jgi:hypothetical protein
MPFATSGYRRSSYRRTPSAATTGAIVFQTRGVHAEPDFLAPDGRPPMQFVPKCPFCMGSYATADRKM